MLTGEDFTSRLSPSSLWPVSFRYATTNGHTPTILATTSARPGMERSFLMMAFRNAGKDAIHSRVSAPLKRFNTNSAIENGLGLRNTDAAVPWRQRFINGEIKCGVLHQLATVPIHFADSLQKPLPERADLHAATQQMHLDQQHSESSLEPQPPV